MNFHPSSNLFLQQTAATTKKVLQQNKTQQQTPSKYLHPEKQLYKIIYNTGASAAYRILLVKSLI